MAGRSSIDALPPEIRDAVHAALRDGATIDQIVARVREAGGAVSRSAVGRYAKRARELVKRQRQADRFAEIWVRELGERPEGRIGMLTAELLRTVALGAAVELGERAETEDEGIDPKEIGTLALALRRIEAAGKISVERELAIRRAAAERANEAGRKAGLSADTAAAIRAAIEGPDADGAA